MKCLNCGTEYEEGNNQCLKCGTVFSNTGTNTEQTIEPTGVIDNNVSVSIANDNEQLKNENVISNEKVINESQNNEYSIFEEYQPKESIFGKVVRLLFDNYKIVGIVIGVIILIIIGYNVIDNFVDDTKLYWVKDEGYEIEAVNPNALVTLNVEAFDENKEEINDIKFNSTCGEIKATGRTVEWTLPSKEGKCTITAKAPSGKKIKKTIKVKKINTKTEYSIITKIEDVKEEKSDDYDKDGLKNEEEKKLKTNPRIKDTDHDGLNDYYEVYKFKTNPLKDDTDNDGITDGEEVAVGLNPLKESSKDDGIKDGERTLSYKLKSRDGVSLVINGKGGIANTTIDVFENKAFNKIKGVSNKIYVFYTKGKMDNASVKIKYDIKDIKSKNLNEKELVLYYFNEDTKEFEAQPSKLDIKNKIITANLTHFSKYVIGDKSVTKTSNTTNIMFVIDNSISMYSEKQMSDFGYPNSSGAVGNDSEFKRLSLTNDLITKLTGNYWFGTAEFSGDYVNLQKFTDNKDVIKKAVSSMKGSWKSNGDGTNIIDALKNGINDFSNNNDYNYLLLMTDGKNTTGSFSTSVNNEIINSANDKNIKICVVGLGNVDNKELTYISQKTGCDFYNASSSSTLDDIYNKLGADINYNLIDTNDDNKLDGTIIADSGFIVTRDGFPFDNYLSKQGPSGNCYGMATFAMLYYTKKLPMKLDKITTSTGFIIGEKQLSSEGYDLRNTYFSSYKNLYDYSFRDDGLKVYMNPEPDDYRYQGRREVWRISTKYRTLLDYSGVDIYVQDGFEKSLLNIESDKFKNNVGREDRELLNAIWRLFVMQYEQDKISFITEPDESYNTLVNDLNNGVPTVLNLTYKKGDDFAGHSVNAVRLIQHNSDPNDFEIEIYDNNHSGKRKYISLQRYKANFNLIDSTTFFNDYEYVMFYEDKMLYTDDFLDLHGIGVTIGKIDI